MRFFLVVEVGGVVSGASLPKASGLALPAVFEEVRNICEFGLIIRTFSWEC